MKPIIAITPEVDENAVTRLNNTYIKAIEMAGGIPFVIPYTASEETISVLLDACDGVVFSGGADVDPKRYGEEAKATCGKIQYLRDELEFTVLKIALEKNKPILAICRGSQLLNAFFGGTLYQDIPTERPSEISHKQDEPYSSPSHLIRINENTPLSELISADTMLVNSIHHQAVKELASELEVMAVADDGLIEATYLPEYRYLRAYQWHPERLVEVNEHNKMIIEDFIAACRER